MTDSYNLLYFLYGASIMFHLMMAWVFCYRRRTRFRIFISILMLLTVAQYIKDLIFLGDNYYATNREERLASSVDVFSIPMYAIVLVEACRPMWLTLRRAIGIYTPLLIALNIYLFMPIKITYHGLHVVAVLYCIFFALWTMRELPIFERTLKQEYSYESSINLYWMCGVTLLFLSIFVFWIYSSLNPGPCSDSVYLAGALFAWVVTCFFFYRHARVLGVVMSSDATSLLSFPFANFSTPQSPSTPQPLAVLSDSDVEDDTDLSPALETVPTENTAADEAQGEMPSPDDPLSEAAFAEHMHLLFEKDHVYLNPHLRLSQLATLLGTNRTYLSQYFNQNCGSTFYDFVNDYRIHYSKLLLHSTNDNLDTIAEKSGFNSLSTFRRAFIQREGKSPIEFRNENK